MADKNGKCKKKSRRGVASVNEARTAANKQRRRMAHAKRHPNDSTKVGTKGEPRNLDTCYVCGTKHPPEHLKVIDIGSKRNPRTAMVCGVCTRPKSGYKDGPEPGPLAVPPSFRAKLRPRHPQVMIDLSRKHGPIRAKHLRMIDGIER